MLTHEAQLAGRGNGWTALYAGDTTLVLEFAQHIDRNVVAQINQLNTLIDNARCAGLLDGILETVPTFRSLAVVYNPCVIHPHELIEQLDSLQTDSADLNTDSVATRHWQLPVLYGTDRGPDLNSVSELCELTPEEVIKLHSSCRYTVYMLGFLPGYAFLGDTPDQLHLPRRREPRLRVPAGSVAIAMQLTGVYPWESPGGWHILGHCPVHMFNAQASPPALLRTGDTVSFSQVDKDTYADLVDRVTAGELSRDELLMPGG